MCPFFHTDNYLCKNIHMKNSTLIDRVKTIIDYEGISVRLFEKNINATQGVINKAIQNNTDIKGSLLISIVENYTHISPIWLLTGKGGMLLSSEVEAVSGIEKTKECEKCEVLKEKIDLLEKLVESKDDTIKAYKSKENDNNGDSKRTSA